jgi:hypothetical protein
MLRRFSSFALLVLLVTSASTPVFAQGEPVEGLEIQVVTKSGDVVASATTRADGSFSFTIKEVGQYYIIASETELSEARMAIKAKGVRGIKHDNTTKAASHRKGDPDSDNDGIELTASFEENLKYDVITAREAGSGMASGKRQYQPILIRKRIDKSSPLLAVSKTNTPVMGKVMWDLKEAKK